MFVCVCVFRDVTFARIQEFQRSSQRFTRGWRETWTSVLYVGVNEMLSQLNLDRSPMNEKLLN